MWSPSISAFCGANEKFTKKWPKDAVNIQRGATHPAGPIRHAGLGKAIQLQYGVHLLGSVITLIANSAKPLAGGHKRKVNGASTPSLDTTRTPHKGVTVIALPQVRTVGNLDAEVTTVT